MSKKIDSKYLVDSKHLIKDDYDDEKIEVDWSIDSEDEPKNKIKEIYNLKIGKLLY